MLKNLTLALLGFLLLCVPSDASWGGPDCGPVGPSFLWVPSGPGEYALLYNGHQAGALRIDPFGYFSLSGDTWTQAEAPCQLPQGVKAPSKGRDWCPCCCGCRASGKCDCGKSCPCKCGCGESGECHCNRPRPKVEANYGVDVGKIQGGQHHINGRPSTKEEVISAIKSVPKDGDKLRLTLIAPTEAQGALSPGLRQFASQNDLLFQAYAPEHWAIQGMGYKVDKAPVVYLQSPNGKVLLRLDSFSGKVEGPLTEAVRKAPSDYDPAKDPTGSPGLHNLVSDLLQKLKTLPGEVWIGALVVLFLLSRKKQGA